MPETRQASRMELNDDERIEKTIEKVLNNQSFIKRIVETATAVIRELYEERIKALEAKVCLLETAHSNRLDAVEQYSRVNNLRVFGVQEDKKEDLSASLTKLFKNKLGARMEEKDIDICHFLPSDEGKTKQVIVRFVRREVRNEVFRKKKLLRGTGISIYEDLSKTRAHLLKLTKVQLKLENKDVTKRNKIDMLVCVNGF
ncbi:hypothetical protein RN001_004663 [Aquatica leii]|uniref:Uncharacterized protein n=1 Tax=Aquatica leii TaxID=1421715 RepID=A0AAN7PYS1_9COLE|nr:hypothetical protein RN001_004663 [Aquatica leii]